jgi:25S rRNA (uracil2634-N3)-methyltransferase
MNKQQTMSSSSVTTKRRLGAITYSTEEDISTVRNCTDLLAVAETVKCAHQNGCIPCAYKVATFDVALDAEICQKIPNRRPELCPRSQLKAIIRSKNDCEHPLGYKHGMSILTVGDGDFSFSLAVARFGCRVVATSYESAETVRSVYESVGVADHIAELKTLGAMIFYNVDATNIERTLPKSLATRTFQRIIWNFPCAAVAKGQDGQNVEMDKNKKLVRAFVQSAEGHCHFGGQIHINHKTKPPFNQWKIDEVAVVNTDNVRFLHRVVLDRTLFHPYIPRKALDRKSFPCHDACTYVFEVFGASTKPGDSTAQDTSTSIILSDFNELQNVASLQFIRVTPHLICLLRNELLQHHESTSYTSNSKTAKKKREL